MEAMMKVPLSQRINLRMILFFGVLIALLGTPLYLFLRETLTGGIQRNGDVYTVDLKAMGNFPFDPAVGSVNDVPEQFRKLDNKKVALEGQMYAPGSSSNEITDFQLVYSIAKCCFGGPPRVQERVFARAPAGKTVQYYGGMARVIGTLHVQPVKQEGKIVSVFTMDVESTEEL